MCPSRFALLTAAIAALIGFSEAHAQNSIPMNLGVHRVQVGDCVAVGTLNPNSGDCHPKVLDHRGPFGSGAFTWDLNTLTVSYQPTKPGVDSGKILIWYTNDDLACYQNAYKPYEISVVGIGYAPTTEYMRPLNTTTRLSPDTDLGGWRGSVRVTVSNAHDYPVSFTPGFAADTAQSIQWSTFDNQGNPLNGFTLGAGSSVAVTYRLLSWNGPASTTDSWYDSASVIMTSSSPGYSDVELTTRVSVQRLPSPELRRLSLDSDSLHFSTIVEAHEVKTIRAYATKGASLTGMTPVRSPFAFEGTQQNDSVMLLSFRCGPLSSGVVRQRVTLYWLQPNFMRQMAVDSAIVHLEADVPENGAPPVWVPAGCPATRARHIDPLPDSGVIVQDSGVLWYSHVGGWDSISYRFSGPVAMNDHGLVFTSSNLGPGLQFCDLADHRWKPSGAVFVHAYDKTGQEVGAYLVVRELRRIAQNGMYASGSGVYTYDPRNYIPATVYGSNVSFDDGVTWMEGSALPCVDSGGTRTNDEISPDQTHFGPGKAQRWSDTTIYTPFEFSVLKGTTALLDNTAMFADSLTGVYRTTDHGLTWQNYSQGLPAGVGINGIVEDRTGVVYVGTEKGLYRSVERFLAGVRTIPAQVRTISVSPNPASSIAHLHYVELPGALSVMVHNALGMLVLERAFPSSASGDLDLDLRELPNGLYRVTLVSEGVSCGRSTLVIVR